MTEANVFRRLPDFHKDTASQVLRRFRRELCYSLMLLNGLLSAHGVQVAEEDVSMLFTLMFSLSITVINGG